MNSLSGIYYLTFSFAFLYAPKVSSVLKRKGHKGTDPTRHTFAVMNNRYIDPHDSKHIPRKKKSCCPWQPINFLDLFSNRHCKTDIWNPTGLEYFSTKEFSGMNQE